VTAPTGLDGGFRIRGGRGQLVATTIGTFLAMWVVFALGDAVVGAGNDGMGSTWTLGLLAVMGVVFILLNLRAGLELRADRVVVRWTVRRRIVRWVDVVDVVETYGMLGRTVGLVTSRGIVSPRYPFRARGWWELPSDPAFDEKLALVRQWWLDHGGVERPAPPIPAGATLQGGP
jgi:hypothetical protein